MSKVRDMIGDETSRAYWLSSSLRTLFFGSNAVLGNVIAEQLHEEKSKGSVSMFSAIDLSFRLLEVIECYQQEVDLLKRDTYTFPWDFAARIDDSKTTRLQWNHKHLNPLHYVPQSLQLLQEAPAILGRRAQYQGRSSGAVPVDITFDYLSYYLNDFHYQTDGWLSHASADRYEMSSETIFLGTQDVMQRQTLVPACEYFGCKAPATILEVAASTGRFATFVRDQFPSSSITISDLSPYYLQKSRENDQYWREFTKKSSTPATLIQANAEDLSFADNSFDLVINAYLFHELPVPARRKAAREMARVVKPGGLVVWTDSVQDGDREAFPADGVLDNFAKFNEPHYVSYLRDDIWKYFGAAGLECERK